jgi:hypothetical protein
MKTNSRTSGRLLARNTLGNLLGQGATLAVLALAALRDGSAVKGLFLLLTLPGFAVVAWMSVLDGAERAVARKWLGLRDFS